MQGLAGLQIGVVRRLDGDPEGEHRILVELPASKAPSALWARLLQPMASAGFGSFFVPEVGDEVLLGFLGDDRAHPVVLGSLYSSAHTPPHALTAGNDLKAVVTRHGHSIAFDDAARTLTVTTPAHNRLVLSDGDGTVLLQDERGNRVSLSGTGIALDSPRDITLSAKGGITLDAVGAVRVHSQGDLALDGLNVACRAQVGLTAQGAATAELSAQGQTTVKGAMVMIN